MKARTWRVRPSELLAIEDTYAAYCLDNAVAEFGMWIESEVDKVKAKKPKHARAKKEAKLKALLSDREEAQYSDPALFFGNSESE